MFKYLIILFSVFCFQSASAWFVKSREGKCSDGGDMYNPEKLLAWETANCTKVSEAKGKFVLKCNSKMAVFQGVISVYPNLQDCQNDGGSFDKGKHESTKTKWKKNYDSKLWSLHKMTCPKPTDLECSQSAITIKEFIRNITPVYEGKGYNCTNTFEVILNTASPPDNFKMSFICMNPSDLCTSSVFWFETEKECKEFKKESK